MSDFKIDSLPVNVVSIAKQANLKIVRNSKALKLLPGEKGKTLTDGKDWIIVYDDAQPPEMSRFVIAHELGHIFLGHDMISIKYGEIEISEFVRKPKNEEQADTFAARLLCPAALLAEKELKNADDIAKQCKVPYNVARQRAKRIRKLNRKNKFFTHPLEIAAVNRCPQT